MKEETSTLVSKESINVRAEEAQNKLTAEKAALEKEAADKAAAEKGTEGASAEKTTEKVITKEADQTKKDLTYEEMKKQYEEGRKWDTRLSQENAKLKEDMASLRKQQEAFAATLAKKSRKDAKALIDDINVRGDAAIDDLINEQIDPVKTQYEDQLKLSNKIAWDTYVENVTLHKIHDKEHYPHWGELDGIMDTLYHSPTCPVDKKLPLPDFLDALYKHALTTEEGKAVALKARAAAEPQQQKEMTDEEKRAATVTGSAPAKGGKGIPIDFKKMPMKDLEAFIKTETAKRNQ